MAGVAGLLSGLAQGFTTAEQQRRQQQREDLAERRAQQAQANTIFNQAQEAAASARRFDLDALQRLQSAGLNPTMRRAITEQARANAAATRAMIGGLANQPGVKSEYGNLLSTLTAPSLFEQPDFDIKPFMPEEGLRGIAEKAKTEARVAAPNAKANIVERARRDMLQYAPMEYVDAVLPRVGSAIGYEAPTQATPLQQPEKIQQLARQMPDWQEGVGGTRILPSGAKQRIYYKDGKPVVDYQKGLVADYVAPEATMLKNKTMAEQLRQLVGMYDSKKALADAKVEWTNLQSAFLKEKIKAFPAESQANIRAKLGKLSNSASDTSARLRLLSILLSAQQRQQQLGINERALGLDVAGKIMSLRKETQNDIDTLEKQRNDFMAAAGKARDLGLKGQHSGSMAAIAAIDAKIQRIKSQGQSLLSGNIGTAGEILGGYGDVAGIDASALLAQQASRPDAMTQMLMMSLMRNQQPAPVQAPSAPMIVNAGQGGVDPNSMMALIGALMGGRAPGAAGGSPPGIGGQPGILPPGMVSPGTLSNEQQAARLEQLKRAFPKLAASPDGLSMLNSLKVSSVINPAIKAYLTSEESKRGGRRTSPTSLPGG